MSSTTEDSCSFYYLLTEIDALQEALNQTKKENKKLKSKFVFPLKTKKIQNNYEESEFCDSEDLETEQTVERNYKDDTITLDLMDELKQQKQLHETNKKELLNKIEELQWEYKKLEEQCEKSSLNSNIYFKNR